MLKNRILISTILIFSCFFAKAQFEKGSYTFGIGVSGYYEFGGKIPSLVLDKYTAEAGYFIKNRWELGLVGDHAPDRKNLTRYTNYSLSAYSRYYFLERKFSPYVEASLGGGIDKRISEEFEQLNYEKPFLRAALGIGANYQFNKRLSLNTGLSYYYNDYFGEYGSMKKNQLNLKLGLKYVF